MCVIVVCKERRETLENMRRQEFHNSDGNGIAWLENGEVHWRKGINFEKLAHISSNVKLPYVMHFRIATAGGKGKELCHPFPVDHINNGVRGTAKKVLFHNGHYSNWAEDLRMLMLLGRLKDIPEGDIGDTRALSIITHVVGDSYLSAIDGNNKFCLFGTECIKFFGYWQEERGIYYSNKNWETPAYWGTLGRQYSLGEEYEPVTAQELGAEADPLFQGSLFAKRKKKRRRNRFLNVGSV